MCNYYLYLGIIIDIVPLIAVLRRVLNFRPGIIGTFQGWLIVTTSAVMILVYGYLAYHLFSRFQTISTKTNCDDQKVSQNIFYVDQKMNTAFCICIVAAFIRCSSLKAVGFLLPKHIDWVHKIGQYWLVSNSWINPLLYFWKSHLSRKTQKMPNKPMEMIKWAFQIDTESVRSTPLTSPALAAKGRGPFSVSKTSIPISTPGSSAQNSVGSQVDESFRLR